MRPRVLRLFGLIGLLASIFFIQACQRDAGEGQHQIAIVPFARQMALPVHEKVVAYNRLPMAERAKTTNVTMAIPVISKGSSVILVDPGPSPEQRGIAAGYADYKDPLSALKSAGWEARQVTHIVLTHISGYSTGNLGRFPNAQILVGEEMYLRTSTKFRRYLDKFKTGGRLMLYHQKFRMCAGVELLQTGHATAGGVVVIADTRAGRTVIMGALAPLQENIERGSGPPYAHTWHGAAKAIRKLKAANDLLLPQRFLSMPAHFTACKGDAWCMDEKKGGL